MMKLEAVKEEYSVVIVGGGLVGASLAIALKQIGIAPLVVEAFAYESDLQPSFDDRTVALSLASLRILDSLELGSEVSDYSEAIKNIHVSDQGQYGFSRLEADKLGVTQLGAVIENHRLGSILLKKIEQESIEYCCPAKVIDAELANNNNQIVIESNGVQKKVQCQLLILAEGARSELKQKLGFESEQTDYAANAIVCNVKPQLPHDNWAYERFTSQGPLALLPLSQNRLSIVWSKTSEQSQELMAMSDSEFAKNLEKTFGARLGKIEQVGKRATFPLVQLVTPQSIKRGCLLIGNSAQSLHPIAGQGLNLALRDINALQKLLEQVLQINPQIDLGDYQLLESYQQQRQSDRQETINATELLARLFANAWTPVSISRNLLMKAMDITPIAKQAFATKAMGFRA